MLGRGMRIGAVAVLCAGALVGCGSSGQLAPPNGLAAVWGYPPGGARPRALLLMIHGGGWTGRSAAGVQSEAAIAQSFQKLGYETLAFDYRRGAQAIKDAQAFYRFARRRVGPKLPICALGPSAGGHISLMLAVGNPDLACVIDYAGPTDLVSLATPAGGQVAYRLAVQAFGANRLASYSPALHAGSIRAKVMLVFAQDDPIVPVAQSVEMARALPGAQLIVLPPGPVGFVHSAGGPGTNTGVAVAAYDSALAAEDAFLANVARAWRAR